MRKVFTSKDEIAHLWAYQHQDEARTSTGNFYFNGKTIYSYGSHFPIATIHEQYHSEYGTVCLFTTDTYSNTTAKHIRAVSHALPTNWTVLYAPNIDLTFLNTQEMIKRHMKNVQYHFEQLAEFTLKQSRARKRDYTDDIDFHLKQASLYVKYFKLKNRLTKGEKKIIEDEEFDFDAHLESQIKRKETEKRNLAKLRKKQAADDKMRIIDWRNGRNVSLPYSVGYILRPSLDGKRVETSRNAHCPIEDAEKLFKLIQHAVETKVPWRKNGKTFEIGQYSVDLININGDTIIGCHHLHYDEILNLAKKLKWVK